MTWNKIHPILHALARYFLASVIIMYSVAKIVGTQFSTSPAVWDKRIGDLSGFELTWYYFGYSYWYGVFIAGSQLLAAFLLFFRRTTRLGIILYLSIMANILVLDFAYDIGGAKGMAVTLTLVALFVLLSEYKAYFQFFFEKPPLFTDEDRPNWMNKLSKAKFVYVPLLIGALFFGANMLKESIMTKNEFYGSWQPENHQDWQRIYFQEASTFSIRQGNELKEVVSGIYKADRDNGTMELLRFTVPESEVDVLNPDSTHLESFLTTKYAFDDDYLSLGNDTLSLRMKRLR